jgi:hypothetical protein
VTVLRAARRFHVGLTANCLDLALTSGDLGLERGNTLTSLPQLRLRDATGPVEIKSYITGAGECLIDLFLERLDDRLDRGDSAQLVGLKSRPASARTYARTYTIKDSTHFLILLI